MYDKVALTLRRVMGSFRPFQYIYMISVLATDEENPVSISTTFRHYYFYSFFIIIFFFLLFMSKFLNVTKLKG